MSSAPEPHPAANPAGIVGAKIFVLGLKIDAEIGVHPHEHGRSQPLVVEVELDVTPVHRERIADTINYEVIAQKARYTAAQGHFQLVEAFAETLGFSLEDGDLVRVGSRSGTRRFSLRSLRRAELRRIRQGRTVLAYSLALRFEDGRVVISSMGYVGLGRPVDQSAAFARFCRAVLRQAAAASPGARFVTAAAPAAGALAGAVILLAAGAMLVFLSALAAGEPALGLDLGARLLFVALLSACPWPWLADERRRSFDPRAVPAGLLPG
jgi:dihydroneopterin aldolase